MSRKKQETDEAIYNRLPNWWPSDFLKMDRDFRAAMLAAVTNGFECCPTMPSTTLGTRHPISNYQRD
jgi:hypothetical protein